MSPQKQNGDLIELEDLNDDAEDGTQQKLSVSFSEIIDTQHFTEIPLVWVSKDGKFSKMYKCRYCPHVNLRKVNIQEHEKMHSARLAIPSPSITPTATTAFGSNVSSTTATKSTSSDVMVEHHCPDCNYICNNAGVLSSHSKVHQGQYGTIHCLVDSSKSDEEQIRELARYLATTQMGTQSKTVDQQLQSYINTSDSRGVPSEENIEALLDDEMNSDAILFCDKCPARFLKENEYDIHIGFHSANLMYKCEYCTYNARQKPHLLAHGKVHTFEYQERSRELCKLYKLTPSCPPPNVRLFPQNSDVWIVENAMLFDADNDIEQIVVSVSNTTSGSTGRSRSSIPISGTDLFQQKSEAEAEATEKLSSGSDSPRIGVSSISFKRYKCPKCPASFEKREQHRVHLALHGSGNQYACSYCDYAVKLYAKLEQHERKHVENGEVLNLDVKRNNWPFEPDAKRMRRSSGATDGELTGKVYWCGMCPYTSHRKDAVDNHQKRHVTISGFRNTYTCDHCDYSVPQSHFLRDHVKLHFLSHKAVKPDTYMCPPEDMRLSGVGVSGVTEVSGIKAEMSDIEENVFDNREDGSDDEPLNLETLNNNEGEKVYINTNTGEMVNKPNDSIENSQH